MRDSNAAANCGFVGSDFEHLSCKADEVLTTKLHQERVFVLGDDDEAGSMIGVEALYKSLLSL